MQLNNHHHRLATLTGLTYVLYVLDLQGLDWPAPPMEMDECMHAPCIWVPHMIIVHIYRDRRSISQIRAEQRPPTVPRGPHHARMRVPPLPAIPAVARTTNTNFYSYKVL